MKFERSSRDVKEDPCASGEALVEMSLACFRNCKTSVIGSKGARGRVIGIEVRGRGSSQIKHGLAETLNSLSWGVK